MILYNVQWLVVTMITVEPLVHHRSHLIAENSVMLQTPSKCENLHSTKKGFDGIYFQQ